MKPLYPPGPNWLPDYPSHYFWTRQLDAETCWVLVDCGNLAKAREKWDELMPLLEKEDEELRAAGKQIPRNAVNRISGRP